MILNYIGFAAGLLPVIAAVFNHRKLDSRLKMAAFFFLISFLIDFLMWLGYKRYFNIESLITYHNNHPLLYLSIFINIIFYTSLYYRSFYNKRIKIMVLFFGIATALFIVVFVWANDITVYPDWANTVLGFYLIVLSLLFFYQLFYRQEFIEIEKQALFWINSGVLVYFSFTIFLYLLARNINVQEYSAINAISNIISNLLFSIGLSCKPQKTVSHTY